MRPPNDQMRLAAFFHPTGHHVAAWLHPEAQIDAGTNVKHYVELAKTAERGKFDLMFLADTYAVREGRPEALSRWPQYMAYFEPLTLLSAIALQTTKLGLVATASTTFNEPYNVARKFASLDLITGGRAGWNVVTSTDDFEAKNFSSDKLVDHEDRYERAEEFVNVVRGLWDSWDDDAFVRDRASKRYYDPAKLHVLNHRGKHFSVRGPLNAARSPQGQPVIFQAGSSETGRELAARTAEAVFTPQHTLEGAQAFYSDVKGRMAKYGRSPDQLKIMPGLNPIVGRTAAEAEEKHQFLQSQIHPDVGLELLASPLNGLDLHGYDLDGPLPKVIDDMDTNSSHTHLKMLKKWAREENLTIRQIFQRYAGARGQRTIKGSPVEIADQMAKWFVERGVDGFLIQPAYLPGGLDDFVDLVIPELQNRGLFREDYQGDTLRQHLGLNVPSSRYSSLNGVAS